MIVQEYMNERVGEDLRVYVVGGKVLGAMRRTAPEGDFRANITGGGTGSSFEVTPEIEYLAIETARILGLSIAGVDLLFGKTGFVVCEANSNPGFQGFEKCRWLYSPVRSSVMESRLTSSSSFSLSAKVRNFSRA
jgi:RimK family alpha-L-glutamate ligase